VQEIAIGGDLDVVVKTGLSEEEIIKIIPEFSALVVRSETKVTAAVLEAAGKAQGWWAGRESVSTTSTSMPRPSEASS
jgi:D-isomer specific 2-hydroxyacid dehydrogenase, catalytic domain.